MGAANVGDDGTLGCGLTGLTYSQKYASMHPCTHKHSHQLPDRLNAFLLITFTFLHFCLLKLCLRQQQVIDFFVCVCVLIAGCYIAGLLLNLLHLKHTCHAPLTFDLDRKSVQISSAARTCRNYSFGKSGGTF